MILSQAHQHDLWSIGLRGLATLLTLTLFWSSPIPSTIQFFFSKDESLTTIRQLSHYCGASSTIVIVGCFSSSYRNLLLSSYTAERRKLGFLLFWFVGCLILDVVWHMPYWYWQQQNRHLGAESSDDPSPSSCASPPPSLYWNLIGWSYSLQDRWYEHSAPLVRVMTTWWLLGNWTLGIAGIYFYRLYYHYRIDEAARRSNMGRTSSNGSFISPTTVAATSSDASTAASNNTRTAPATATTTPTSNYHSTGATSTTTTTTTMLPSSTQDELIDSQLLRLYLYQRSLLVLSFCGTHQTSNASLYLYMSYALENQAFANVGRSSDGTRMSGWSAFVFFGLHGFRTVASATATWFAMQLLLDPSSQRRKRKEEQRTTNCSSFSSASFLPPISTDNKKKS